MKNNFINIFAACIVVVFLSFIQTPSNNISKEKFRLSENNYQSSEIIELKSYEFQQKIDNQESFVVIARNITCPANAPLSSTVEEFLKDNQLTIYSLMANEFKESSLSDEAKYLPTAAIYRKGKLVAYLHADSDKDLDYYKDSEEFKTWLEKYIEL